MGRKASQGRFVRTAEKGLDPFWTPEWVTRALLERFGDRIPPTVWEPACGIGHISKMLGDAGHEVLSSDVHDWGYGSPGTDFLTVNEMPANMQGLITNPPFSLANEFIKHALTLRPKFLALLLRLTILETPTRARQFTESPPTELLMLAQRPWFQTPDATEKLDRDVGGFYAAVWLVWHEPYSEPGVPTMLSWYILDKD